VDLDRAVADLTSIGQPYRRHGDEVELFVRVTPRASRDAVEGVVADAEGRMRLKLRVRAVPDQGAANLAACELVAIWLGLPRRSVRVAAGHSARQKTLLIEGEAGALESLLVSRLSVA
jgi:uncharacterized protein YggU (UPF0235/DUF167 family)